MSGKVRAGFVMTFCMVVIAATLAGCQTGYYTSKQPKMSETDIWISEDPSGYFIWLGSKIGHGGEILLNGELYQFVILFDQGTGAEIYKRDGKESTADRTKLLAADCKFSPDELVLKIRKYDDYLYSDSYDKIVFVRQDFDPETDELPTLTEAD